MKKLIKKEIDTPKIVQKKEKNYSTAVQRIYYFSSCDFSIGYSIQIMFTS